MTDGHVHLEKGPLSADYVLEFVKEAERKGIDRLQILDHTHRFREFEPAYEEMLRIPQQREWLGNREKKFCDTVDDMMRLMDEVKAMELPVQVSFGLEVCYMPESEEFLRRTLERCSFDFLVGSVHSVDGAAYDMPFSGEILWDVRDTDSIYRRYYELLEQCVSSGLFTQLGHPDTIKIHGSYPSYDLTDTYRSLASCLNRYSVAAENNTGTAYRYGHPDIGLSDGILKVFREEGVRIITASDAHKPSDTGTLIPVVHARSYD